ncbi:PREDICTED: protein SON-like [Brassica oleracea var. oleracea]|uniref:protein SON-like n=1 Tax=Brassica oleracea var. oleracea TaxID=109376 RepID=UPI0006A74B2B|nr:PREDICTED: protein SON-like [Brassica oleracea var. oleracea]
MSQSLTTSSKNKAIVQVQEDDDLVILPAVDNSELIARFKLSLVGRLFNRERRSVESLIALLPRPNIWDVEGRVCGVDLGNQRFQFDFDSEDDLQKVLSKRPCHYNKWSFALERWAPHIGDSFPNTMTFWVTALGIPTHFWLDPIFRALGRRLGNVGLVEEKTAKFQVEINAELPLKFSLCAQLPSGEIVPVSLEYVNLHRWCHSCRLISHEEDTCPTLSEEQRENHRLIKEANREANRDQGQQSRLDMNRKGDLSKRFSAAAPKAPSYLERRSGKGTQRDNRDRVWKRMDSRYAPRDDHREKNRHVPRERDILPPSKEAYNKRRYDDSFAASKHREKARREERKRVPTSQSSKGEIAPEEPGDKQLARPSSSSKREKIVDVPLKTSLTQSQLAKQVNSSPDHVRERPFRLALQKSSGDLKLKGKVGDLGDSSESVRSAKKSLRFAAETNRSPPKTHPRSPPNSEERKKKSWYEMTLEEEEEVSKQATDDKDKPYSGDPELNEVDDPNA